MHFSHSSISFTDTWAKFLVAVCCLSCFFFATCQLNLYARGKFGDFLFRLEVITQRLFKTLSKQRRKLILLRLIWPIRFSPLISFNFFFYLNCQNFSKRFFGISKIMRTKEWMNCIEQIVRSHDKSPLPRADISIRLKRCAGCVSFLQSRQKRQSI